MSVSICRLHTVSANDLALRLYPQVPTNARFALRDTVLPRGGGEDGQSPIFVAKGVSLVCTILKFVICEILYHSSNCRI